MKRRIIIFFWVGLLCALGYGVHAQTGNPLEVEKKVPVTGSERFDFMITRTVMLGKVSGVPFEPRQSGALSLGIGYGLPLGRSMEFKFEPRVTWQKLYFVPTTGKYFPTTMVSDSLVYEKQRIAYAEIPVSFKFKLARNLVDRYKLLLEAGFVFGRRIGSTFKSRYAIVDSNNVSHRITIKSTRIPDLADWRMGPFVRLGTSWVSAYGFFRMTDLFLADRRFLGPDGTMINYPIFPKIELGLTFAL